MLRYGTRGKSAFARDLGIPITTYVHYEAGRIPPVDLLVTASQVTGVRLEWLILGTEPRDDIAAAVPPSGTLAFPEHQFLIPLVGSTAAGLAHYWSELESEHGPAADHQLEKILSRCLEKAKVSGESQRSTGIIEYQHAALIQYSEPDLDGILEFVSAPEIKKRYPDAVAWRIDGESMAPRYVNGDLVITSLSTPAVDGHPCVCRQQGQIGVNCKIYQAQGDDVLLIPVNEKHNTQHVPKSKINWAYRVVSSIKLHS